MNKDNRSVSDCQNRVILYLLLADGDGTMRSRDEPFGVAVTTKEEAERFVKEVKFAYSQSFQELAVFETAEEAMNYWREKNRPSSI